MNIQFNKKFLKDLANLPTTERSKIERFLNQDFKSFRSFREIEKLEKLSGYQNFYKIRFGHYRVGIQYKNGTLIFERVLHRKEIYRYFP